MEVLEVALEGAGLAPRGAKAVKRHFRELCVYLWRLYISVSEYSER